MIVNDIRAGYGVAVVDPHGDLAEKIIEYIKTIIVKPSLTSNLEVVNNFNKNRRQENGKTYC